MPKITGFDTIKDKLPLGRCYKTIKEINKHSTA